ncbi:MAG: tyrosine recombinase [Methylobacteriaceae bacterium]|nr:tyrosine recombinase [Methylobacteriaceae bacterium]
MATDPATVRASRIARRNAAQAELWLDALAAERGAAAGTLTTYRDDLACYLGFLAERGLALDAVRADDVRTYLAGLDARGFAPATLSHRRSVLRTLHRFLVGEGLAARDPVGELAPMRRTRDLPYTPGVDEVARLLETAHERAADDGVGLYRQAGYARRAALLETLYASGMRVSEAVSLPARAVRPGSRALTIRGKGNKERLVPLHATAVAAIGRWRELAAAYGSRSDVWLFHSVRDGGKPLTRQAALAEIKEAARAAGLPRPERLSPHKLRHAFATHLLAGGVDLRSIQETLGHADLGTTEIYTHVDLSRARAMMASLHPLGEEDAA